MTFKLITDSTADIDDIWAKKLRNSFRIDHYP